MSTRLLGLFDAIAPPEANGSEKPIYAVVPVPEYESYFVGKDRNECACLLVAAGEHSERMHSPIRLENLDVQFQLRCHLRRRDEAERMGTFTVVRCRSLDAELTRYFLLVCDTIIGRVGDQPKQGELAAAILRLAAIFQKMQKPASRPLNGLFGELFFIWSSASPPKPLQLGESMMRHVSISLRASCVLMSKRRPAGCVAIHSRMSNAIRRLAP